MSDSPILFVRNVARRFGGTIVLEDMNLMIERGSIHAQVGEIGAGKSTLTRCWRAAPLHRSSGCSEKSPQLMQSDGSADGGASGANYICRWSLAIR